MTIPAHRKEQTMPTMQDPTAREIARINAEKLAIGTTADWIVERVERTSSGYRLIGLNLCHAPGRPMRRFVWRYNEGGRGGLIGCALNPRFDFSRAWLTR